MGVKISALPVIVTPAMSDVFPVVQSGVTYKESMTQLSSLFATAGINSNITELTGLTTPLSPSEGGTGVDNGTNTLTLAGSSDATFIFTGTTSVTFPTSGTLATTATASGIVNSGLINQLAYYASSGTTISGLATSASKILVTNASSVPGLSSTLPAFLMGGTVSVNGQVITNSLTDGNVSFSTNGTGLLELNSTQGVNGISNDGTLAADSATLLPTQAAVKAYVNTVASGFSFIAPCLVANTANYASTYANGAAGVGATLTATSNGAAVTDGVSLSVNDRVLFQFQTTTFQNGVYYLSTNGDGSNPSVFTRATDYDSAAEILPGTLIPVFSGTTYAGSIWAQTSTVTTVGTDAITFIDFAQPSNTFVTLSTNQNITGIKSFNSGSLVLKGATSGTSVLNAAGIAGTTTFTLPGTTDTLAGIAATQTLTNKTISGISNTLTNISYGSLADGTPGNLITWSAANAPALVATGAANQVLTSNGAGAAPTFQDSSAAYLAPTVQEFTSGSGTYTTAADVLYIRVVMVGAGGGGGGSGFNGTSGADGGTGGSTTFGTSLLTCTGGEGGISASTGTGGAGGVATMNSPAIGLAVGGGCGCGAASTAAGFNSFIPGGNGGSSALGGAGGSGQFIAGSDLPPAANSGSGGAGAGMNPFGTNSDAGSGGGAGAYIDAIIPSPSATYSYSVGAAGTAGAQGSNGFGGGAGAAGRITVWEYYQ